MTPVYIANCFAMLHPAPGRHGVVICGPIGDDALNTYRPLVFLAERFAAAGNPTLRLEYYGAGDSGGEDGEAGRFQAWLNGIAAAVNWLRDECGVGPVTLVGVRIGAVIAAHAACDIPDVAALVLLSPLASGRQFLRQMTLRARNTAEIWQVDPHIDDGGWFEAHGLRLDPATHDMLSRLDMASLPQCPAPQALVLDEADSPTGMVVFRHLAGLGAAVTREAVEGLTGMRRDPYENTVPHAAFATAVAWHQRALHGDAPPGAEAAPHDDESATSPPRIDPGFAARGRDRMELACLATGCGDETAIRFGPHHSLFGILSTPAHPRPDAPSILIANTGANPRYGNSRGAVSIARFLAAHGIASLRMDGAGIGDAAIDTGEHGVPYSAQGDSDLSAGIDELTQRFASPVLVLGLCSGAYHALRAANHDPRVAGLILVNLQKFVWREGESLSVVQRTTFRTTRFYLQNMVSATVWRRLREGEINAAGITRALAGRAWRRMLAVADPLVATMQGGETPVGRVRRQARQLKRRGVPILFVLAGNDPGLDEIAEYFGARGRQFSRLPNVMFRILEGADHTFSAHWARETLQGMIATFLRQRFGLAIAADELAAPASPDAGVAQREAAFVAPALSVVPPVAIDTSGGAA